MLDAKLREIQALRGIAVISVVLIHTVSAFVFMPAINPVSASALVIDVFSHFAVPLFIFISGFVLTLKSYSLETFYLRRFKSVVPAYLIFSVLYAIYYQKDIINSILMANAETHLPFLKVIMTLYLMYPIIIKLYDFKGGKLNPLMLILTSLVLVISPIPTFSTHLSFLNVLPYFLVGIYVSRNYDTIHTRIELLNPMIVLILVLPLWAIEAQRWFSRYYSSYGILPIININILPIILYILIFIFIYKAAVKLPIMSWVGNYAFGIYLVHQFFMNEIRRILYGIGLYYVYPSYYIILFITAFTLSLMAAIIWSRASCTFKNQFGSQRISKQEDPASEDLTPTERAYLQKIEKHLRVSPRHVASLAEIQEVLGVPPGQASQLVKKLDPHRFEVSRRGRDHKVRIFLLKSEITGNRQAKSSGT